MLIIGERINSSRKLIAEAIAGRDAAHIHDEAQIQASAGADYLDVNAGVFADREAECLQWLIETVQDAVDLPLCIDSPRPDVIEAVMPLVKHAPMLNSITLEPSRLSRVLALAVDCEGKAIGLCQDEGVIATTREQKVAMAERLVEESQKAGFDIGNLYIDPLVYPFATNIDSATATLGAIEEIMARFPVVHTICGLSNVSYGLPKRRLVNRTFLVAAVNRGLDSVMMDPTDAELYASLRAGLVVSGRDEYCLGYIAAYRNGRL
jgi:5-methyltetrahydrofolate corrinoid/iron sulfur protein methyltransferase